MPRLLLSDSLILLHGRGPHPGSGPAVPQHPTSTDARLLSVLTAVESSVSSQEDTSTGPSDGAALAGLRQHHHASVCGTSCPQLSGGGDFEFLTVCLQ